MINLLFFAYSRYMGILQNDVDLIHEIEAVVGKQLEEFECKEQEVLSDITRVRHLGIWPDQWSLNEDFDLEGLTMDM